MGVGSINIKVMVTSVLKVLVNNLFLKSFDIIFMGNEKNY